MRRPKRLPQAIQNGRVEHFFARMIGGETAVVRRRLFPCSFYSNRHLLELKKV